MKKLSYVVGGENAMELKKVLRDLSELYYRLGNILGDCEIWINKHDSEELEALEKELDEEALKREQEDNSK